MVVVDVLFPIALRFNLSYLITDEEAKTIEVGSFVRAPIGSRTFLGIIVVIYPSGYQVTDVSTLKYITVVEDQLIPITPKRIALWKWISEYYLCTLGEVMKSALLSKPPRVSKSETNRELSNFNPLSKPLVPYPKETLDSIQQQINLANVIVLKGAHQKTALTIHIVVQILLSGKNVLLLTPEIGSGDQLFHQMKELLHHHVYLFHSRLTPLQRQKVIQKIADQEEPMLIIGMRSALLLADMFNFGLIIMEDEHDLSYKQIDPAPRFHARDLALFIGKHYHIPVILTTSCPSLECAYNVRLGKFHQIIIDKPAHSLPNIEMVDTLRLKKAKQMIGSFSPPVLSTLKQNLAFQKQSLFFSQRCAQLIEELHTHFPTMRTKRLDETHNPTSIQQIITEFRSKKIDILLGFQTVYKNIDWGNIGLVAIFDADRQLSRSDFRAHERTYQILTTIIGSIDALLPNNAPRFIVQTEQPEQPFYSFLQSNNAEAFILDQLRERKMYQYPPFVRLISVRFKHPDLKSAFDAAQQFQQELFSLGMTVVSGPFTLKQNREEPLNTQLLWIHLARHSDSEALKRKLFQKMATFKFPKGIIQIDVDPY